MTKQYLVTFTQFRAYSHKVTAESADQAMVNAVNAFYRGQIQPDYFTLDNFEAKEEPDAYP